MARADMQTVRTTAYTHTESDHLAYGARNALGGTLQSATVPEGPYRTRRALKVSSAWDVDEEVTITVMTREKRLALAKKAKAKSKLKAKAEKGKKGKKGKYARARKPQPPRIGSAAADWSRWPVGTTFRLVRTGQVYKIDDYGWALAGRNTIDLYMSSKADMNRWGVRHEPIEIIKWGDRQASLSLLEARQHYKHCRRMVLALQERHEEAAALR
jgi:3D (Asp-Asp-Asp) domain-containing protein